MRNLANCSFASTNVKLYYHDVKYEKVHPSYLHPKVIADHSPDLRVPVLSTTCVLLSTGKVFEVNNKYVT